MPPTTADSPFDIVLGTLVFASFAIFAFLVATLRSHVDERKAREEASVASIMAAQIPPERVLTLAGRRRVKIAKIAIGVCVTCVAVIVVRKQIL